MTKSTNFYLDHEKINYSKKVLRALAHPLRLSILKFIDQECSINVNQIYSELNLEQSITSQHLSVLRNAGLVITDREGKFINYSINYERLENTMEAIDNFLFDLGEEENIH